MFESREDGGTQKFEISISLLCLATLVDIIEIDIELYHQLSFFVVAHPGTALGLVVV